VHAWSPPDGHGRLRNGCCSPPLITILRCCAPALGNPFHAVQCFRKALALKGSDDPDVLLNLGALHTGRLIDSLVRPARV
jgi:hypothetical protein